MTIWMRWKDPIKNRQNKTVTMSFQRRRRILVFDKPHWNWCYFQLSYRDNLIPLQSIIFSYSPRSHFFAIGSIHLDWLFEVEDSFISSVAHWDDANKYNWHFSCSKDMHFRCPVHVNVGQCKNTHCPCKHTADNHIRMGRDSHLTPTHTQSKLTIIMFFAHRKSRKYLSGTILVRFHRSA